VVIVLTKISIVLLYLRIFPRSVSNRFTYTCWAVVAGLTSYGLVFIIYFAFECRPSKSKHVLHTHELILTIK
jgi:hypothetical protein